MEELDIYLWKQSTLVSILWVPAFTISVIQAPPGVDCSMTFMLRANISSLLPSGKIKEGGVLLVAVGDEGSMKENHNSTQFHIYNSH